MVMDICTSLATSMFSWERSQHCHGEIRAASITHEYFCASNDPHTEGSSTRREATTLNDNENVSSFDMLPWDVLGVSAVADSGGVFQDSRLLLEVAFAGWLCHLVLVVALQVCERH